MTAKISPLAFCIVAALAPASTAVAQQQPTYPQQPVARAQADLFTYANLDLAWEAVQRADRPLFLFVSMEQCFYCEKMERETLYHPKVAQGIRQLFVTAKMHREGNEEWMAKFGVRSYPTTLVIAPEGDLIARLDGFYDPKQFVLTVRPALARYVEVRKQNRQVAKHSSHDVESR